MKHLALLALMSALFAGASSAPALAEQQEAVAELERWLDDSENDSTTDYDFSRFQNPPSYRRFNYGSPPRPSIRTGPMWRSNAQQQGFRQLQRILNRTIGYQRPTIRTGPMWRSDAQQQGFRQLRDYLFNRTIGYQRSPISTGPMWRSDAQQQSFRQLRDYILNRTASYWADKLFRSLVSAQQYRRPSPPVRKGGPFDRDFVRPRPRPSYTIRDAVSVGPLYSKPSRSESQDREAEVQTFLRRIAPFLLNRVFRG